MWIARVRLGYMSSNMQVKLFKFKQQKKKGQTFQVTHKIFIILCLSIKNLF